MGKNFVLLYVLLAAIFPGVATAATIQGTVYEWYALEPLGNVIIEVNTSPPQKIVTKTGSYSIGLPEGDYQISARYYLYGMLKYYAEENVTVGDEGNFTMDLIMLPALDEESLFETNGVEIDELLIENGQSAQGAGSGGSYQGALIIGAIVLTSVFVLIVLYRQRQKRRRDRKGKEERPNAKTLSESSKTLARHPEPLKLPKLPCDLNKLLETIRLNDGRMTQRELRKRMPYGEADKPHARGPGRQGADKEDKEGQGKHYRHDRGRISFI